MNLFEDNETYTVETFKDRDDWLSRRHYGIGGSDAASAIGRSKWTTNVELWEYKTGNAKREDISENPAVRYGAQAEEHLRKLYELENENLYEVQYQPNTILISKKTPIFLYSPDGLLIEKATGRKGILEIKTAQVNSRVARMQWKERIPDQYYIQVLHGLNVTGFDFVELTAQLDCGTHFERWIYHIERADVEDDLKAIAEGIKEFWSYVETGVEPPLWIN